MKILRGVILCTLFIAGVFICSANVHRVDLVLWPNLGLDAVPASRAYEVPLFLLVLAAVLVGLVLGGAAALFEQGRLRLGLRRAEKETKRLKAEEASSAANLEAEKEQAATLSSELEAARSRIAELEARIAEAERPAAAQADAPLEKSGDTEPDADQGTDDEEAPPTTHHPR